MLNMLCYDSCKTVEFRFLRPSFNFNKIYLWLAIFNGILKYAEKLDAEINSSMKDVDLVRKLKRINPSLITIMHTIYPSEFAMNVVEGLYKLEAVTVNQTNNKDYIGKDTFFDDRMFTNVF